MEKKHDNFKKFIAALVCLMVPFTCTGCWDKVEVQRRAVVLSLGIDKNMKDKKTNSRYVVSYAFPSASSSSQGGGQGGGGGSQAEYEVSAVGPSFFEGNRELSSRVDKNLYYSDAKTLVFGKDLLKDPKLFKYFFDVIFRQDQFSKTASYVVADGKAEDIIKIVPKATPYVGQYISGILANNQENGKYPSGGALEIAKGLISSGNAIIPRAKKSKDEVKLDGCGVIKKYKLIGFINGEDTKNLLMARGDLKKGIYGINKKNKNLVYEMTSIKVQKKVKLNKKNKVDINLIIKSEGSIAEYYNKNMSYKDGKKVNNIQQQLDKSMKKDIEKTLKLVQKKYAVDLLGISDELQKYHPGQWKKMQKKWDSDFKKVKINVNVITKIRRVGNIEI